MVAEFTDAGSPRAERFGFCLLILLIGTVLSGRGWSQCQIDTSRGTECWLSRDGGSWGKGWPCEFRCYTDYGTKTAMNITVDGCSQSSGDSGSAIVYMVDPGKCIYCEPGAACGTSCHCCDDNITADHVAFNVVIVRVSGSQKSFDDFFPEGITAGGVVIDTVNCDYVVSSGRIMADYTERCAA